MVGYHLCFLVSFLAIHRNIRFLKADLREKVRYREKRSFSETSYRDLSTVEKIIYFYTSVDYSRFLFWKLIEQRHLHLLHFPFRSSGISVISFSNIQNVTPHLQYSKILMEEPTRTLLFCLTFILKVH